MYMQVGTYIGLEAYGLSTSRLQCIFLSITHLPHEYIVRVSAGVLERERERDREGERECVCDKVATHFPY
jgi:hypothetical protein